MAASYDSERNRVNVGRCTLFDLIGWDCSKYVAG